MGDHYLIPRGAESAHPPGYVQLSDPGAVGAFKPWWVTDDDDEPTEITDFRVRNHDNTDWISFAATIVVAAPVTSVFSRTGAVVATEGDYSLTLLSDVTITTPGSGHYLRHNGTAFVNTAIILTDLGSGTPDATTFLRGDGTWAAATGATLADGDYGSVTVSSSGSVITIDAGAVTTTELGGDITAFIKTVLDDADAGAVLTTLGISAFVQTILNDADAAAVFTTLGISAFVQTILNDADAAAVRTTIGAAATSHTHAQADITDLTTDLGALDTRLDAEEALSTSFDGRLDDLEAAPVPAPIQTVSGATHDLVAADAAFYTRYTNAGGCIIAVPLEATESIAVGSEFHGIGTLDQLEFDPEGGVTVNTAHTLFTRAAMSVFTLKKVATNEWDLFGDLEPA